MVLERGARILVALQLNVAPGAFNQEAVETSMVGAMTFDLGEGLGLGAILKKLLLQEGESNSCSPRTYSNIAD